jgi:chromosome segregation ATPase
MQAATKAALKRRVKKWGEAQRAGFPSTADMLAAKVQYLEDVLLIYQQEVDSLGAALRESHDDRSISGSEDLDLTATLRTKASLVMRPQQTAANTGNTAQSAAEIETLRMQLLAAETDLLELREMYQSKLSADTQHLKNRVSELEDELAAKNNELEEERDQRVELEREASQATRRLQQNNDFLLSLDATSHKVRENLEKQLKHHQQLVASLLQTGGSGGNGESSRGEDRDISRDDESELVATQSVRSGTESRRAKSDRHTGSGGTAGAAPASAEAAGPASSVPATLAGRTPIERLTNMLAKVESVISSQQVELAVATRCAIESFALKEKDLRNKAQQSYLYCETQMARIKELEQQFLEQRDYAYQERDRALNTRDRLVSQLRSLEAQRTSKTTTKSVDVQTIARGDFSVPGVKIDRAESMYAASVVGSVSNAEPLRPEKKAGR